MDWELARLLSTLHDEIESGLRRARAAFGHPTTMGDACEGVWLEMLTKYLPQRYRAARAHVVDSNGVFSQQIDVVIFDRQYSPFIFDYHGGTIVPAESVYAVFEAKQSINAAQVKYAQEKLSSVRRLHRTSLPIPHAGGVYPPKPLARITGGLLTFESEWKPPLGAPLIDSILNCSAEDRLDFGCVAAHGLFSCGGDAQVTLSPGPTAATAFLFELIARLQTYATVPMIDVRAYAAWLAK